MDETVFPLFSQEEIQVEKEIPFQFCIYRRGLPLSPSLSETKGPARNETPYLDLIRHILSVGKPKVDRTGVGTLSVFGVQMKFDLQGQFPLLTTKKMFWKGIVEELLWMIHGSTDSKLLSDKGVGIWEGNGSRSFLDQKGFVDREVGDLGPIYGFQWRHAGATYQTCKTDYKGQGHDQLKTILHLLQNDPDSRRILFSAWNVSDLDQMVLPPCHVLAQFYVEDKTLSCQLYQRSGDMGLGVPFNIASYSLLTYLLAHLCHLKVGTFIHTLGDAHIYLNHIQGLQKQLTRTPRSFPTLQIDSKVTDLDSISLKDIHLENYIPYDKIDLTMAV